MTTSELSDFLMVSYGQHKYPSKTDHAKDLLLVLESLIPHDNPIMVTTLYGEAGDRQKPH